MPTFDLHKRLLATIEGERENRPCHTNRASSVGIDCLRRLFYERTAWQDKLLPDLGLVQIFLEGDEQEDTTVRWLQKMGFRIVEQQRPFSIPELQLTGHIDGKMVPRPELFAPGELDGWPQEAGSGDLAIVPFDVKSMAPWIYTTLDDVGDFIRSEHAWHRGYVDQMTCYLRMDESFHGLLVPKDKNRLDMKGAWVTYEEDRFERIEKKLIEVNRAVASGEAPDRLETGDCRRCPFMLVCQPTICSDSPDGFSIEANAEIEELIRRYFALKEGASEYTAVDKRLKELLEGRVAIIGDWLVEGNWIDRKPYTVEAGRYWRKKITPLGGPTLAVGE